MEGVQRHTVIRQEDDRDSKGKPMEGWDSEWNTSELSGRDWESNMSESHYVFLHVLWLGCGSLKPFPHCKNLSS